jgi:hypothetical protein
MVTRKRKTNRKKRKTKRYVGGAQKLCTVCCPDLSKPNPKITCYYHTKSEGAPPGTLTNVYYEDHIRTHPICKYCMDQEPLAQEPLAQGLAPPLAHRHYDTKALAEHIKTKHSDKYKIAQNIKTDLLDKNKNLITELNNDNTRIIGVLPELDEFYKQIANKETKMAEEELKKQRQQTVVKAKPDSAAKAKVKADAELKAKADAKEEAELKARVAEENKLKFEEAKKRKAEKEAIEAAKAKEQEAKAEEQEAIRKAAKAEADRAKKAAKKAAKAEARELEQMGQEEELSKQLHVAQTVDEVIDIINNTLPQPPLPPVEPPLPPVEPPLPPVEPPLPPVKPPSKNIIIKTIFEKKKLNDNTNFYYKLKNFNFQLAIHDYILSMFPLLSCNTGTIHNASYYKTVSLIIFIVGILNMLFKLNKANIKLIIKGGKAAQMMLSTYGYPSCDINSDDIDILLIQENGHDREYLMDIARQIAYLIKDRFINDNNESISILEPTEVNPNIYKISMKTSNGYKPISDIDFKYDNSGFFTKESFMEFSLNANYYGNEFGLLYYFQNPIVFLEEKKHYLAIYENIVQKTHDGSKSCDCNVKNMDYDCNAVCNYRTLMVEKFKKYIEPFERLLRPNTPSARRDV